MFGAWEDGQFIGAVIFGRGATPQIGKPFGLTQTQVCELVRVALTAHTTPVSRILAICIKHLRRRNPRLRLLVSYADPRAGHHGGIYQACGWTYIGTSDPIKYCMAYGKKIHRRSANSLLGRKHKMPQFPTAEVKHKYILPLDNPMREQTAQLAQPYPCAAGVTSAQPADQPEGGG